MTEAPRSTTGMLGATEMTKRPAELRNAPNAKSGFMLYLSIAIDAGREKKNIRA
jgi:hypothetical protein